MYISTPCTSSSNPTSQRPAITPGPLLSQAKVKRDQAQVCGNLSGKYPNAQEPICAGTASICTFSDSHQGCCDDSDNCTFYTSCNEGYSPKTCDGPSCLQCGQDLPYCSQYAFDGSGNTFLGFSCGALDISGSMLYGFVGSATTSNVATSGLTSATTTESGAVSSTSASPRTTTTSTSNPTTSTSGTNTSAHSTATATNSPNGESSSASSLTGGKLAGVIIAAIVGALLFAFLIWFFCIKGKKKRTDHGKGGFLTQGRGEDDDSDAPDNSHHMRPYGR